MNSVEKSRSLRQSSARSSDATALLGGRSDGTVIFTVADALAGGSKRTADFAKKHGKPWLHLSERGSYESAGERLLTFIRENDIKVLNVAGSRGSKEPRVAAYVKLALEEAFYPRVEAMVVS